MEFSAFGTEGERGSIADIGEFPVLGLKRIKFSRGEKDQAGAKAFARFLEDLICEATRDALADRKPDRHIENLSGENVHWKRQGLDVFPLYIEQLELGPFGAIGGTGEDDPAFVSAPGNLRVSESVIDPAAEEYFERRRETWRARVGKWLSGESALGPGGLSCSLLEIPAESLTSGKIDIRPATLHALDEHGRACDRGDARAQAAVANSFWQTYWASGAIRADRGEVFPVAFLPIDRSFEGEFCGVFREPYVSLRRKLFGRTSILAFTLEVLTGAKALFFDTDENRFVLATSWKPGDSGASLADALLAVAELNRTGFPDAYTGENARTFAGWVAREQAGDKPDAPPAEWMSSDNPASLFPKDVPGNNIAQDVGNHYIRIHRVVPYAGCAFLNEVAHDTGRLKSIGKLRGLGDSRILAATNSTFFLNFPEEYATLHSAMNDPVAAVVEDGVTQQIKTLRRTTFVVTEDGQTIITTRAGLKLNCEALVFEGEALTASFAESATKSFAANQVGPVFFGSVVVGNAIVETFEDSSTEVPANGWVTGDSEAFGGELEPRNAAEVQVRAEGELRDLKIRHAFAVGPLLVEEGKAVPFGTSKEDFYPLVSAPAASGDDASDLTRTQLPPRLHDCAQHGVPPMRFPHDWNDTRAPRTAIGVRGDGSVVVAVVDGRADLTHSVGVTLAELAQMMINLGCRSAMNCDGGGSSVMHLTDERAAEFKLRPEYPDGLVTLPSDRGGNERLLPVPLLIVAR